MRGAARTEAAQSLPDSNRQRLLERVGERSLAETRGGTIVVIPSVTAPEEELRRIPASTQLEERLLFTLLLLRHPRVRILYVTSLPVAEATVDYHLRFLPSPEHARARLDMVALQEPGPRALTYKLLDRPDAIKRVRRLAGEPEQAYLLCYKVTHAEHTLSARLGLPLDGPEQAHLELNTKTASRRAARRAGVAVLDGEEGLSSVDAVEHALARLHARRPHARAAVIKLNDGFAGRGNAIVSLPSTRSPLASGAVELIGADETWKGFAAKLEHQGAIVEELLEGQSVVSSCVQMRIAPTGAVQVISAYDMVLAGKRRHVYSGCRYPADESHREALLRAARKLAQQLSDEGLVGWFGLDFLVDRSVVPPRCFLSEINLRMGGGTHPFWMALLAGEGSYDSTAGEIHVGGRPRAYVATDDVCSRRLLGRTPSQVIDLVDRSGLAFDRRRGTGIALQFLGAVRELGMMGLTCIADTPEEAEVLRRQALAALS